MCWGVKAREHRKNNLLDFQQFKKIVDDVSFFCSRIFLNFCGEPLINKDIFNMIEYAEKKNIITLISTNSLFLTKTNVSKLLEVFPNYLTISLDAATKNTYESMRTGGNFETALKGIQTLVEEREKKKSINPIIDLQMILTKKNANEIEEFILLGNKLHVDLVSIKSLYIDHQANQDYIKKLTDEYFIPHAISRYNKKADGTLVLKKGGVCPHIKTPVIASDGDVYICCFDVFGNYKQSNALDKNFCEIWNDHDFKQFRKHIMAKRKLDICKYCSYTNMPRKTVHFSENKFRS
jgi:radical SAM protein with 4Fe4S-binding SPASM domain